MTETLDEHQAKTIIYTNSEGQVVAKSSHAYSTDSRVSTPGKATPINGLRIPPTDQLIPHYLTTYYVYDDFGSLRTIIQPEGINELARLSDWNTGITSAFLSKWCFTYKYDSRRRITEKQSPGGGLTYLVYNSKDQVIGTSISKDRTPRSYFWQVIKYDELGRPILTGYANLGLNRADFQSAVDSQPANNQLYETRTPGIGHGYSLTQAYPNLGASAVQTLAFYDDYDYPDLINRPFVPENGVADSFSRLKGYLTGHAEVLLDNQQWLITKNFYDEKGQLIQSRRDNLLGGITRSTSELDFLGRPKALLLTHTASSIVHTIRNTITYDHAGRALLVTQQMDYGLSSSSAPVIASSSAYNALGELVDKKLHSSDNGTNFLQSVDFRYNIRGWLKSINDRGLSTTGDGPDVEQDLFGLELKYNDANMAGLLGAQPQYNGNISQALWRTRNSQTNYILRGYSYQYDLASRLNAADYSSYEVSAATGQYQWGKANSDYSVSGVTYDDNGNILGLKRRGRLSALSVTNNPVFGDLDKLKYKYEGNQLTGVDDEAAPSVLPHDFEDNGSKFQVTGSNEYAYDVSGNLLRDDNKGISSIVYNQLNLPTTITFSNGNTIQFEYAADGQKVRKVATPAGQTATITEYVDGFVYENSQLIFGPMPEGRVLLNPAGSVNSWKYEYHITDHLGNLRFAFRDFGGTNSQRSTASMEPDNASDEELKFKHIRETRMRDATHARSGDYVARLSAVDGTSAGPSRTILVRAGDSIYTEVYGRFDQTRQSLLGQRAAWAVVAGITSGTPSGFTEQAGSLGKRQRLAQLGVGVTVTPGLLQVGTKKKGEVLPAAYLRCQAFTRDSQLVATHLQPLTRDASDNWQQLKVSMTVDSAGYVEVSVGNESAQPAYFDDLQLRPIDVAEIQENHYDPFGLNLVGIESSSSRDSKFQFGGKEKQDEFGLNWNDHGARFYDPQLGRWHTADPLADFTHSESPYVAFSNNPVSNTDPSGMTSFWGVNGEEHEDGWYAQTGMIDAEGRQLATFDERIHSQEDVEKLGLKGTYISETLSGVTNMQASFTGGSDGSFHIDEGMEAVVIGKRPISEDGMNTAKADGVAQTVGSLKSQSDATLTMALTQHGNSSGSGSGMTMVGPMDSEYERAQGRQLAYDRQLQERMGGDMSDIGNPGAQLMLVRGALDAYAGEYAAFKIAANIAHATTIARSGASRIYEVGSYNALRGVEPGLDAHHVIQGAVGKSLINGYDYRIAPTILVPKAGHTIGSGVLSRVTIGLTTPRQALARDILELRRVYPDVPSASIEKLIYMNKKMYPNSFTK